MAKNLDLLTREELGTLFPIIISESKSEWPDLFLEEKSRILRFMGRNTAMRIEHFGSTAVPGLAAKPTIDILVEIPAGEDAQDRIKKTMALHGYIHMLEQTNHLMFVKGYTPEGFKGQCYHIHMGDKTQTDLWERLCFRDYLIANPSVANEYSRLKRDLAVRFRNDREAYTDAKTEFIERITRIAVAESE